MSEKEHPARTAGRYVRAAGVAIRKERERLAAESARRAAEAAQQAPPSPPEAPAVPSASSPPAGTEAKPGRPPRTHAPAPAPRPIFDRILYVGFVLAVGATGLAALNVDLLANGTTQVVLRLVLGGLFIGAALPLLTNWQQASERLIAKLMKKFWGMDHPVTRSGRFVRRIAKDLMTLVGIAWLALGVFEILRALVKP